MWSWYFAVKGLAMLTLSLLVGGADASAAAWIGALSLAFSPIMAYLESLR